MQTVYFLGRLHVLVLHLPLGLLTLAVALEIMARFARFASLRPFLMILWMAGAATAILTVILGFMHAAESAFAGSSGVEAHRWAGVALMLAACAVAVLRWRAPRPAKLAEGAVLAAVSLVGILVIVSGHLGGSLTHGEDYLIEYAPAAIRRLAGVSETQLRPKPTELASADLYLDVVAPALKQRCGTCHNERKRGGQLSLASFEALMQGGDAGAVIVPGSPDRSDLFRRISLPRDHKDFMPKEGKTPLTDDEVGAIRIWIAHGAQGTGPATALMLDGESTALLERVLGLRGEASAQTAGTQGGAHNDEHDELPTVQATSPEFITALESSGFVVRPIAKSSNLLDVDLSGSQPISPQQLELLKQVAPQILRLNLANAGLADPDTKVLSQMVNLRRLRLEGNSLGDAGVRQLAALTQLRYLNLHGTRVTDSGLESLATLEHLRELYLWNSAVTNKGVATLRVQRGDLRVSAGADAIAASPAGGN
jgi:uncharacterized membrane protein